MKLEWDYLLGFILGVDLYHSHFFVSLTNRYCKAGKRFCPMGSRFCLYLGRWYFQISFN
jgi:hypothetical protein